jgi:hypothetical protein
VLNSSVAPASSKNNLPEEAKVLENIKVEEQKSIITSTPQSSSQSNTKQL